MQMSYLALPLLQEDEVGVLEGAPDGGHRVLGVVHVPDDALKTDERKTYFESRAKIGTPQIVYKVTRYKVAL